MLTGDHLGRHPVRGTNWCVSHVVRALQLSRNTYIRTYRKLPLIHHNTLSRWLPRFHGLCGGIKKTPPKQYIIQRCHCIWAIFLVVPIILKPLHFSMRCPFEEFNGLTGYSLVHTVEHSYNKPEIQCWTVCYKQEFVISEQFYCSTWLRSLLSYIEKFVIEEFLIEVLHCTSILYIHRYTDSQQYYKHMHTCTRRSIKYVHRYLPSNTTNTCTHIQGSQ